MLGNFEKRLFNSGEKVWFGSYKNLANVLHWHFECEIIRIVDGNAKIKIGDHLYSANSGDCFFCASEELHYIIGNKTSLIDVMIVDESIASDLTTKLALCTPALGNTKVLSYMLDSIKNDYINKPPLYREAIENTARGIFIDIFRNNKTQKKQTNKSLFYQNLITKISEEFAYITFKDAVRFCGYSPAHFSKMFKKLSGINFCDYLNIIKIENAILLLQNEKNLSMTTISSKCGFSTVRNFNRVFKNITGYSPRTLPHNFIVDSNMRIKKSNNFDPTDKNSILI